MRFDFESLPGRVSFGAGSAAAALTDEISRGRYRNAMVVCSSREAPRAAALTAGLGDRLACTFTGVRQHVPIAVAEVARSLAATSGIDVLISIGGGSATGTAKAVALTSGLPIIAVPTTYSGSEMTPVWGLTTESHKETGVDPRVKPSTVIYDPDLLADLPDSTALTSAANALAHCVEAFWTPLSNPVLALEATEGIRVLARGMDALVTGAAAREDLLYGAFLGGLVFAGARSGLHHKICHILGGAFDLPHAQLHAVVLPHVLEFTAPSVPTEAARMADALGSADAVVGLRALYDRAGVSRSLQQIGMLADQLESAIDIVVAALPIVHPRLVDEAAVRRILTGAFAGRGM